jgi:hypothetical protein
MNTTSALKSAGGLGPVRERKNRDSELAIPFSIMKTSTFMIMTAYFENCTVLNFLIE